jgi:hypothetical protein
MTAQHDAATPAAANEPIASLIAAHELVSHFSEVMDTLLGIVEEETRLVQEGRLDDLPALEGRKADLARSYIADTDRLTACKPYLAEALPDLLDALRQRHDNFRSLLQINLTVLATAQAVSAGIVQDRSAEIGRKTVSADR